MKVQKIYLIELNETQLIILKKITNKYLKIISEKNEQFDIDEEEENLIHEIRCI